MADRDAPGSTRDSPPPYALRVTFAYRGSAIRFAGSQRTRMIVPAPATPVPQSGQSGYWFEVRAADGRALFHRALHAPVRVDAEVFADDRRQSIRRVPLADPQGEFEALMPDLADAETFVLFGPPTAADLQAAPSRELLRMRFDDLRQPPPGPTHDGTGFARREAATMSTADGFVAGTTRIVDHGPNALRYNIVIVGDGYRAAEMAKYHTDVQSFVTALHATAPFGNLWCGIDIHRVDVVSTDSGADDPVTCGDGSVGSGAAPKTYFDATFCGGGSIRRLLTCNSVTARNVALAQVPEMHMTLVIVNAAQYGGSGGSVATFSTHPSSADIALHEMGHTAFGFADEYEYYAGCGSGETDHNTYPGGEPVEPNVTANSDRNTIKWRSLLTSMADALPTTINANCTQCDTQANPKLASYVGAYSGARYFHCGVFRPSYNCRMRSLASPFCAVCQKTIRDTLTPFLPAAYQGLWWNAPPGSESGWGISFAHQEDTIFATWFTYNAAGNPWWLVMTATKGEGSDYSGTLFETRGPAFSATPFDPALVTLSAVGSGTLSFTDVDNGTFAYTVNGISQTKSITRQRFATPVPTCTFGLQTNLRDATNYQDLWWAWPPGSESGWGISVAHQGNIVFAAWYTYDQTGAPLWMVVTATQGAPGVFSGTLYTTTGPPFNAVPFNPANVMLTAVGNATLTFTDGNSATFAYTAGGVSQTKPIARQIFRPPGTVCS